MTTKKIKKEEYTATAYHQYDPTHTTGVWTYPDSNINIIDENGTSYPYDLTNVTMLAGAGPPGLPAPTEENCIYVKSDDFYISKMEFESKVQDRGIIAIGGQPRFNNFNPGVSKVNITGIVPNIDSKTFDKMRMGTAYLVFGYDDWNTTIPITEKGLYIFITDFQMNFGGDSLNEIQIEGIIYDGEIENSVRPIKGETKITDPILKELNEKIEEMTNKIKERKRKIEKEAV